MKVSRIHRLATREIIEAILHYQEVDDPQLSVDFRRRLRAALIAIRENPRRYSYYQKTEVRKVLLERFPYQIFYVDYPEFVRILALAHTSRRPGYWKTRIAVD